MSELESLTKLTKDLTKAARNMSDEEARILVDNYYIMQDYRKSYENQIRSIDYPVTFDETGKKKKLTDEEKEQLNALPKEPHETLDWLLANAEMLEKGIKTILDKYTDQHPIGRWLKSICGIGPVIAAGLLAHIDITKCPTAGHIWSYAGLNPESKWNKGEKRPWNARLKVVCWKIGQAFVKVSNNEKDVYGKIYKERKAYESAKNDAGEYKEQALQKLKDFKIGHQTEAYKWYSQGKLPPAHIQQRAERYATKIFLSHLHEYWYEQHFGVPAPAPYPIAILGHAHKIEITPSK